MTKERGVRSRVREFGAREVYLVNGYWERAELPVELIPKVADLNLAGNTMKCYGGVGGRLGDDEALSRRPLPQHCV